MTIDQRLKDLESREPRGDLDQVVTMVEVLTVLDEQTGERREILRVPDAYDEGVWFSIGNGMRRRLRRPIFNDDADVPKTSPAGLEENAERKDATSPEGGVPQSDDCEAKSQIGPKLDSRERKNKNKSSRKKLTK